MGLRPSQLFYSFSAGIDFRIYMSDSDVILTSKDGIRAERVNESLSIVRSTYWTFENVGFDMSKAEVYSHVSTLQFQIDGNYLDLSKLVLYNFIDHKICDQ